MGLDITVYKPIPVEKPQECEDFYVMDEFSELEIFAHLVFERENEYHDIEGDLKKLGHVEGETVTWVGIDGGDDEDGDDVTICYRFQTKEGEPVILKNPSIIKRVERCLTYEEVGYQRKGANKQFYADGMWGSPCVVDSKTLHEHWEKYFSFATPDSEGGWGSGVEYELENEDRKRRFKEQIIDHFVEGETFVVYH